MSVNPNLVIVTSDWHVVSDNTEAGIINRAIPSRARAATSHIRSFEPFGVIDMGDCKDHFASAGDELDRYIENVVDRMPWLPLNSGFTADYAILPGNHDEDSDYTSGATNDFTTWNSKMWAAPYHWTADWDAPLLRFIALDVRIIHGGANTGKARILQGEIDWLEDELAALPGGWKAIVCAHYPIPNYFDYNVVDAEGGTNLKALLAAQEAKITCVLGGHRHMEMSTTTEGSNVYIQVPGVAYSTSDANALGGFVPVVYNGSNQLTFHYHYAGHTFGHRAGYSPILVPR